MLPLDLHKLTPWNLEANTKLFISDLGVTPKTLYNMTFKDIAAFHKSPTVAVEPEDIVREAKAQNKFLEVSSFKSSINPLRPDISDIELALIHSSRGSIPDDVLCTMLNITRSRLKYIRQATESLYKMANTPLPSLPLVTITDTSRYWTEGELLDTYRLKYPKLTDDTPSNEEDSSDILEVPQDYGVHYKDLLRQLESQAKELKFPVNDPLCSEEYFKGTVPNRTSIPSTLLKEDHEDYSNLSSTIWANVSREEGLSGLLSLKDGTTNDTLNIDVEYTSKVTNKKGDFRILNHQHTKGGYNPPLKLPIAILKLAINLYNLYITNDMEAPAIERLVINLLSSLEYTTKELGVTFPPLSSNRGHCMPAHLPKVSDGISLNKGTLSRNLGYFTDSPPLVYPKFASKHYGYGVVCHECGTFLSQNTIKSCKHMVIETFLVQETGKFGHIRYTLPSIYLYMDDITSPYSLYYYNKDVNGSISQVYTKDLLQFYSNFILPIHQLPFEP